VECAAVCRRKMRWSQLHPNVAMLDVLTRACSRAISVQATFSITHAVTHTISFSLSPSHIHSLTLSLSLSHTHTHTHTHTQTQHAVSRSELGGNTTENEEPAIIKHNRRRYARVSKNNKRILYLSNHVVKNVATTASIVWHSCQTMQTDRHVCILWQTWVVYSDRHEKHACLCLWLQNTSLSREPLRRLLTASVHVFKEEIWKYRQRYHFVFVYHH
jgi:hypothetical protein